MAEVTAAEMRRRHESAFDNGYRQGRQAATWELEQLAKAAI